jgi:anti-sigma factor RsiW
MNCEKFQDLLSALIDGSLTPEENSRVETHLGDCVVCAEARGDLTAILVFCRENRGAYETVPNERALWLRISNTIESDLAASSRAAGRTNAGRWSRLMNQSWQLSLPRLAAAAAVIVIVVALGTAFGVRRFLGSSGTPKVATGSTVEERYRQQQQVIAYWNQRVEQNKARWNPQMRETFDRNMSVIDTAVNDSMRQLTQNPHDGVSEDILNAALNDKVELLKEFADL